MALILLASAGYAAYVKSQENNNSNGGDGEPGQNHANSIIFDESIQLEGKTKLTLLPSEQKGVFEIPITTLTWFEGDYRSIQDPLRERLDAIVVKNPYLAGWLSFDPEPDTPIESSSSSSTSRNKEKKLTIIYDEAGADCQRNLFQVYDEQQGRASYGEESSGDENPPSSSRSPQPAISIDSSYEQMTDQLLKCGAMLPLQNQLVGRDNAPLFRLSVIPDSEAPMERFAVVLSMTKAFGDASTYYKLLHMTSLDNPTSIPLPLIVERDLSFFDKIKSALGKESVEYLMTAARQPPMDLTMNRNEPTVVKVFHIRPAWFEKRSKRARRSSAFLNASMDFSKEAATVSENSILASWFFKLNQADVAFLGLSFRDRLEGLDAGELHAGSYTGGIPYTPVDYETPELIEKSIAGLQRCGGPDETPTPLPPFRWNHSASICVNWASKFQDSLKLSSDCRQLSHVALHDATMLKTLPGRLSLCVMFTSDPGGMTTSNTASDDIQMGSINKRLGVMISCRQSVWQQIEESGIVEEMIFDDA